MFKLSLLIGIILIIIGVIMLHTCSNIEKEVERVHEISDKYEDDEVWIEEDNKEFLSLIKKKLGGIFIGLTLITIGMVIETVLSVLIGVFGIW